MSELAPVLARRRAMPAGLLLNRNFVLLWAAYGISAMGDHISEMNLLKSQDAMGRVNLTQLQALLTFLFFFPYFVLGPISGLIADRLPRRGIMIVADLVRAGLMFNFALLLHYFAGSGPIRAFTPVLMTGVFAALFSPARSALLPTVIAEDQLVRANAMTSGLGVIASMCAMLLGGYLADHYPPQYAFSVDACTFLASAILLAVMTTPAAEARRVQSEVSPAALLEAVRYVRGHRRVGQLILIAVVVWSCGAAVRSAVPAIVRDVYGFATYTDMSSMLVFLGAGMLAGALILTALGDALRSELAITWSLAGIGVAMGLLALTVFARLSGTPGYAIGAAAVLLSGVFAAGVMASYNALLQRIVPNRLRGRVFGLTDLITIAGLLLATGGLGIPAWANIDRWVGWILLAVMAVVLATALLSLRVRLRESPFPPHVQFWVNVNEFYCRWWFRLKRLGQCTVPANGPVIVVASHTCGIDPILLIAACRHRVLGFMIAEEYYDVPLGGRLIKMIECIPVRRGTSDVGAMKQALRHLRAGKPLGIFIEGRIPRPGEVVEPKDGPALLALRTGATIVPARITGTRYDESLAQSFFHRHHARVRFGQPFHLPAAPGGKVDRATLHLMTALIADRLRELAAEEPATVGGIPQ